MATINESGLYSLSLGSCKPETKRCSYNGPVIDPMKVLNDCTLTSDPRRVAKHFKKRHGDVLRAFDKMECNAEFNRLNFQPVEELDAKGEGLTCPSL